MASCATTGRKESAEVSLPGFIPGGCSAYLAGKVDCLPDVFQELFAKNGIPEKVIKSTDRIYCCFVTPDKLTVFLQGDYRNLHAKTYFNVKKRYEKHQENGFDYYIDLETGAGFSFPDKSLIIYTEDDIQLLLAAYDPASSLVPELDGLYTRDIFVFRDNPAIQDLKLKRNFQVYLWASCAGGMYTVDSDLCFSEVKDAKVSSPVVKLFIQNLIKKIDIAEYNNGRPVSVQGTKVLVRSLMVPVEKGSPVFEYFISELEER